MGTPYIPSFYTDSIPGVRCGPSTKVSYELHRKHTNWPGLAWQSVTLPHDALRLHFKGLFSLFLTKKSPRFLSIIIDTARVLLKLSFMTLQEEEYQKVNKNLFLYIPASKILAQLINLFSKETKKKLYCCETFWGFMS